MANSSAQPAGTIPAGFATWAEVFAVQDKLNAAAEKIVAIGGGDGYAGIVAAPQNRELRVYWKGVITTSLHKLADGLGVPVRFLPAKFTEREMTAETKRLAADPQVQSVGPEADGSGLTITLTSSGQQALQSGIGIVGTTTMPLHLDSGPSAQPYAGRQDDRSSYLGGARYRTSINGCSTGFAVIWHGLDHMLSAGHCGNNGQTAIDGGGNPAVDTMGVVFNDVPARDTLMIDTPSERWVYVGAWNSNTAVIVDGATSDFVGNVVCTGGATSGEHCGMSVTHVNQWESGYYPMIRAAFNTATCAVARGDSGGPVYHYTQWTSIIGHGTITSGRDGTATCPNAPTSNSSNVVWYAPLLRPAGGPTIGSLQYYGASIR